MAGPLPEEETVEKQPGEPLKVKGTMKHRCSQAWRQSLTTVKATDWMRPPGSVDGGVPCPPQRPASAPGAALGSPPLLSLETGYSPGTPARRHRQPDLSKLPLSPPRLTPGKGEEGPGLKARVRGLDFLPRPTTCLPVWLQETIQPPWAAVSCPGQWGW